jgi:hypothetical protein
VDRRFVGQAVISAHQERAGLYEDHALAVRTGLILILRSGGLACFLVITAGAIARHTILGRRRLSKRLLKARNRNAVRRRVFNPSEGLGQAERQQGCHPFIPSGALSDHPDYRL